MFVTECQRVFQSFIHCDVRLALLQFRRQGKRRTRGRNKRKKKKKRKTRVPRDCVPCATSRSCATSRAKTESLQYRVSHSRQHWTSYGSELVSRPRAFQLDSYSSYSLSQGVVLDAVAGRKYAATGSTSAAWDSRSGSSDRVDRAPLAVSRPRPSVEESREIKSRNKVLLYRSRDYRAVDRARRTRWFKFGWGRAKDDAVSDRTERWRAVLSSLSLKSSRGDARVIGLSSDCQWRARDDPVNSARALRLWPPVAFIPSFLHSTPDARKIGECSFVPIATQLPWILIDSVYLDVRAILLRDLLGGDSDFLKRSGWVSDANESSTKERGISQFIFFIFL